MVRFGKWAIYHSQVEKAGWFAKAYVKLMGCSSYTAFNFFLQLKRILPERDFRSILDAGCGKGDFSFYLAEKYPQSVVEGWDKSDETLHDLGENIEVCNRIREISGLKNAVFFKRDLQDLEATAKYDLIITIHVLEHIENNARILRNFFHALKPGGLLHVQMPSETHHHFFFLSRFTNYYQWHNLEHVGETYNLVSFTRLLETTGFSVVTARTDGHAFSGFLFDVTETLRRRNSAIAFALFLPIAKAMTILLSSFDNGKGNVVMVAEKPVNAC